VKRSTLLFVVTALVAALPFACTAQLEEGCIGGPCEAGNTTSASTSSSSSSSGAGGGGVVCDPAKPVTGQYPCDVFAVLMTRCFECHTNPTVMGAPFSLLTYEKTQELYSGKPIWQLMKGDIESGFMPFGKPDDLMGAELKTMEDWFAKCAPPVPDGTGCEMP
jgi:hypothetical protein